MSRPAPLRWVVLLLLLVGGGDAALAAKSADARRGLHDLFHPLQPQRGVAHRSMAVVPLVSRAPATETGPAVSFEGVVWRPVKRSGAKGMVALEREPAEPKSAAKEGPQKAAPDPSERPAPEVLWTSGLVLRHGSRERLTRRPVVGPPPVTYAGTVGVEKQVAGTPPGADVGRTVHGPAPISFRHTMFATRSKDALADLLGIAASVVGLEPRKTPIGLGEVSAHPAIAKRLAATRKALLNLETAYGGDISGHVVFLGNRPVEIVAFPSSVTYRSYVRAAAPSLALSLVIWEGLYGRTGPVIEKPEWAALRGEAEKILRALGAATVVRAPKHKQSKQRGELWRVRAKLPRARLAGDVGWLLGDPKGKALLVELFPNGMAGPLPAPAPKPGAAPIDEDPHDRMGGALTKEYIRRFLERFHLRRRAQLR